VLEQVATVRLQQPRIGTRKLQTHLADAGMDVGRDRLFTWLRERNDLVKRKRRGTFTTYSRHSYAVAPNLIAGRTVTAPKQVIVSDITYLRLQHGFAYLFLVTDLFSRKIVGWHVSRDLSHYGALQALHMAASTIGDVEGLVHHSDRGSQYCCHEYLRALSNYRILASMTDANHCYQNAVAERVNGILKDEFDLDAIFGSFEELHRSAARAIQKYDTIRKHGSLNLRTPQQVFDQAA
jgi:transposase InsO family protein